MKRYILVLLALIVMFVAVAAAPIVELEKLSPEALMLLMGGFMSLLFTYFPGLNTWYASKAEKTKKIVMAVLLAAITAALYAGMCIGMVTVAEMVCDVASGIDMIYFLVLAIVGNQGIFKLTVQPIKVVAAKVD